MLSARDQLDVINAYRRVGSYRGAAEICGVTHKTVKRVVERDQAQLERVERRKNYESVRGLVADELRETKGKISAKRLLPLGWWLCRLGPQLPPAGGAGAQQVPPRLGDRRGSPAGGLGCR